MTETMIVAPAYGRDYSSANDAVTDWVEGKDFRIISMASQYYGSYCSCRDFDSGDVIEIRFDRKTNLAMHTMS